jgi:hypothetical protein
MESKPFEDLYEVLDVDFGSSKNDIIQKYKEKLGPYQDHITQGKHLDKELKWEIKLLKIAKYVLTNDALRKKYNLSRILQDSDEKSEIKEEVNSNPKQPSNSMLEYKELRHVDIPLRKDKPINLKELADRQFERFDHKHFDLNKDRQLSGVNVE